jgi:hypothetical protein
VKRKTDTITTKEIAYVLLGQVQNGILFARMSWKTRGEETSVLFDGERVLKREEAKGDVLGFYHTHPEGCLEPSGRDDRTMDAWTFCFGKSLLCVIATRQGARAWVYGAAGEHPREVKPVVIFDKKFLIAYLGQ